MPSLAVPIGIGLTGAALGGGLKGSAQGQSVRQASTLSPGQSGILDQIGALIRYGPQAIGETPRVPTSALGPVGPSELQQQAFNFSGGLPNLLQSQAFQQFDPNQITQQFQPTADFARQGFQNETIPAIMAALGAQGTARSSGASNILGRAGRDLELGLSSQLGQQQFGAQQALFDRQAALPGIAGQLGAQLANIGGLQRSIPAEQQAFELSRFQAADPLRNPAINIGLGAIGTPATENIAFEGYRQPSLMESILPAAGSIFGAAGQAGGFSNLFS